MGRPWTGSTEHHQLLLAGGKDVRWLAGRLDAFVPDARRRALRRWRRPRSGRLPWRDGALARAGRCARADHGYAPRWWPQRAYTDDATALSVPTDCEVQGNRQYRRCGELRVRCPVATQ